MAFGIYLTRAWFKSLSGPDSGFVKVMYVIDLFKTFGKVVEK